MVTQRGRKDLLAASIRQFNSQTYIPRELVIVTNAPDELPRLDSSAIRVYPYPEEPITLGELRNFSIERAQGDVLAIWDDDDVRQDGYLASQVEALLLGKQPIVMLPTVEMQCKCGAVVESPRRPWECTMVIWKNVIRPYDSMDRGEDTALLDELSARGIHWTFNNSRALYLKKYHGNNAWSREHHAKIFAMTRPRHNCIELEPWA
jgi:glycosyltransferase involved in cell wall biosynthesis